MLEHLIYVNTWYPKYEVELAEQTHFSVFNQKVSCSAPAAQQQQQAPKQQEQASLSKQIQNVRKTIQEIDTTTTSTTINADLTTEQRLTKIETTHQKISQMLDDLKRRVEQLEVNGQPTNQGKPVETKPAPAPAPAADDNDVDLFGSDDEEQNEETKKRLAAYAAKKSTKTQIIAKSTIVLDVKPWDDETDLKAMEAAVRSIVADGLVWGPAKFLPVAFGVKKLQIGCVVEDDKIGTDFLEEQITAFEDFVQSVDIVSFNKI